MSPTLLLLLNFRCTVYTERSECAQRVRSVILFSIVQQSSLGFQCTHAKLFINDLTNISLQSRHVWF